MIKKIIYKLSKIICIMLLIVSFMDIKANAANRIIYDIEQLSMNEFKITLKWAEEEMGNIQVTACSKLDDNTIQIYYATPSNFNRRTVTFNVSENNMSLHRYRKPNVVLKNQDGSVRKFSDLPKNEEMSKAIQNLYSKGLINGYNDGTFRPDSKITKEEFCAMYLNLMKIPVIKNTKSIFIDLPDDRWSRDIIMTLSSNGVIKGQGNDQFGVLKEITLGEVATIIDRGKKLVTMPVTGIYQHLNTQHWANQSITNLISKDYIFTDDVFYGENTQSKPLTRGEIALILNRD